MPPNTRIPGDRLVLGLLSTTLLTGLLAPARANPYDDCTLEHMSTAQNEAAAYAVERACISKTSVPITTTPDVLAREGKAGSDYFNTGFGYSYGLLVTIKNATTFNITELVVVVQDQKTSKENEYVIDQFREPLSGPGYYKTLGEPALVNIIPSGKTRSFFVQATEVTADTVKDVFKRFTWDLRLSKGIPAGAISPTYIERPSIAGGTQQVPRRRPIVRRRPASTALGVPGRPLVLLEHRLLLTLGRRRI